MGGAYRSVFQYSRVEKYLRDRVRSGRLKPGDRIPTESEFTQQFGVSRMTVRQALSRLTSEGLIERHRGRRGSCVAEPRLEHTQIFLSVEEELRARGAKPSIKLLGVHREMATGRVAEQLALRQGTKIVVLERLRLVDGQVIGYEIRYLPRYIGDALTTDEIHNQPLVPSVRRILGRARSRMSMWVTASVARGHEAKILGTKVGAPVLVREHTWYVDPEGPVQYGKSVYLGDRFRMAVEFTSTPQSGGAGA